VKFTSLAFLGMENGKLKMKNEGVGFADCF